MKRYLIPILASLVFSITVQTSKAAVFTVSATIGGIPSAAGATLQNFNGATPPYLTLGGTAAILTGPNYGVAYVPPYFSGSTAAYFGESPATGLDETPYVVLQTGGTATFNLSSPASYFGLCWGSLDEGNSLSFYDSANALIGTLTSTDIPGVILHDVGPNGTYYVNINSPTPFKKVVASSTSNSFEFDDVAFLTAVPEPSACSLMLAAAGLRFLRGSRRPAAPQPLAQAGDNP